MIFESEGDFLKTKCRDLWTFEEKFYILFPSKSSCPQGHVGSNPTASAKKSLEPQWFQGISFLVQHGGADLWGGSWKFKMKRWKAALKYRLLHTGKKGRAASTKRGALVADREPSCGKMRVPFYRASRKPLERGPNNYYSTIQGSKANDGIRNTF